MPSAASHIISTGLVLGALRYVDVVSNKKLGRPVRTLSGENVEIGTRI